MIAVTLVGRNLPLVRHLLNPRASCLAAQLQKVDFIRPICGFAGECGLCAVKLSPSFYQRLQQSDPCSSQELTLIASIVDDPQNVRLSCKLKMDSLPNDSADLMIQQPQM